MISLQILSKLFASTVLKKKEFIRDLVLLLSNLQLLIYEKTLALFSKYFFASILSKFPEQ